MKLLNPLLHLEIQMREVHLYNQHWKRMWKLKQLKLAQILTSRLNPKGWLELLDVLGFDRPVITTEFTIKWLHSNISQNPLMQCSLSNRNIQDWLQRCPAFLNLSEGQAIMQRPSIGDLLLTKKQRLAIFQVKNYELYKISNSQLCSTHKPPFMFLLNVCVSIWVCVLAHVCIVSCNLVPNVGSLKNSCSRVSKLFFFWA